MGATDFLLSTLSLAHAATKEQDAACAPACNSQYSQLMQSCRVCISIRITDAMCFDDESATRLEKGNKLLITRHIPVYDPCGYCCSAIKF